MSNDTPKPEDVEAAEKHSDFYYHTDGGYTPKQISKESYLAAIAHAEAKVKAKDSFFTFDNMIANKQRIESLEKSLLDRDTKLEKAKSTILRTIDYIEFLHDEFAEGDAAQNIEGLLRDALDLLGGDDGVKNG